MYEREKTILQLITETIDKIIDYSQGFSDVTELEKDIKTFDAILMNFIVIGESIGKLSDEFKTKYSEIEWRKIYAFRNIIAHDYFGVLAIEVWQIVKIHLTKLKTDLVKIIDNK